MLLHSQSWFHWELNNKYCGTHILYFLIFYPVLLGSYWQIGDELDIFDKKLNTLNF